MPEQRKLEDVQDAYKLREEMIKAEQFVWDSKWKIITFALERKMMEYFTFNWKKFDDRGKRVDRL